MKSTLPAVDYKTLVHGSHEDLLCFLELLALKPHTSFAHPRLSTETYLLSNKRLGMVNVIKLGRKECRELDWHIYQLNNFCDAISYGSEFVAFQGSSMLRNAYSSVQSKGESLFSKASGFKGFLVSQMRPYHYFFDQYINAVALAQSSMIDGHDNIFIHDGSCYMDILPGNRRLVFNQSVDGCYVFPCTNWGAKPESACREMFSLIRNSYSPIPLSNKPVLWIGVTGQKRSWVEQIQGYQDIANHIFQSAGSLTLLIDGHSSTVFKTEINKDDMHVACQIESGLHDGIHLINLIGKTYHEKVSYALSADVFIANSGTGCMVPALFAEQRGVIHGNGILNTFQLQNTNRMTIVDGIPVDAGASLGADHLSYSIDWKKILDATLKIMAH